MYMVCGFGLPDGQTFRFPDTTGRHLSEQSDISRPEVNPFANMPFCRIGESACQAEENRRENGMGKPENRTSTDYRSRLDINLFATKFKANGFVTVRTTSCLNHVSYKSL
jgi:hypothetical protein